MLFCSQKFLVFFVLVFTIYWIIRPQQWRVWILLAASFFFYASWNKWLALIICVSTALDYALARGMDRTSKDRKSTRLNSSHRL